MDILVIGDRDHARAKSVDWMEPFPNIEEFDLVIIALPTLTQEIFDRISSKPISIREQMDTLFETGRSVWCILEKLLTPTPPETGPKARPSSYRELSNYDWLLVRPVLKEVGEGHSLEMAEEGDLFEPYLSTVKKWDLEIVTIGEMRLVAGRYKLVEPEGLALSPLAINKSGKMLAARIEGALDTMGSVCLLPKPTRVNVHEAIEILIDIATGKEKLEPDWREGIMIPGIEQIEQEISRIKDSIKSLDKKIDVLKGKWSALDHYRDVFSLHEDPQVAAVQIILKDMEIDTRRTTPDFPVDLIGNDVAVEVTSDSGKIDSDSRKMFQLTRFLDKHHRKEKVILVANTYKRQNPKARRGKEDFTGPVKDFLRLRNVCALTSLTLLELWKLARQDKAKARRLILKAKGELRL